MGKHSAEDFDGYDDDFDDDFDEDDFDDDWENEDDDSEDSLDGFDFAFDEDSDDFDEDSDEDSDDLDEDSEDDDLDPEDIDDFDEDDDDLDVSTEGTDAPDEDSDDPSDDSDDDLDDDDLDDLDPEDIDDFDEDDDDDLGFDSDDDEDPEDASTDEDDSTQGTDSPIEEEDSLDPSATVEDAPVESFFDSMNDQVVIDKGKFTVTEKMVYLDDLAFLQPLKNSRRETFAGLRTSIQEMGVLSPIFISPTENYQDWLEEHKDDEFAAYDAPKYKVLDGFRRVFACKKLGIEEVPARVITFHNAEAGAEFAVVFAQILNRTQKHTWPEIWGLMQVLESQSAMSPATLEWLLKLDPGESMKLKDIMLSDYPEIAEQLFDGKKNISQAYNALQKARKEESSPTGNDDSRGINDIEGHEEVTDEDDDSEVKPTLSDEEVKELLEMGNDTLEDLEDESFSAEGEEGADMFGETAADHVQDTQNRERLSPELRSSILRRDDFTCQVCGFGEGIVSSIQLGLLECHHITAVYTGGSDSSENFVTVCNRCHSFIHILAGFNCKIGMSKEEFNNLPENDQSTIKNAVKYAKVLLEAESRSGKKLKKYKPQRIPFWTAQSESQKMLKILAERGPNVPDEPGPIVEPYPDDPKSSTLGDEDTDEVDPPTSDDDPDEGTDLEPDDDSLDDLDDFDDDLDDDLDSDPDDDFEDDFDEDDD